MNDETLIERLTDELAKRAIRTIGGQFKCEICNGIVDDRIGVLRHSRDCPLWVDPALGRPLKMKLTVPASNVT